MKTTYIAPETEVITVGTHQIVCASTPGIQTGTANTTDTQEGGGYMLDREDNSLWGDEDSAN